MVAERELRERQSETILRLTADGAPRTIKRVVALSVARQMARGPDGELRQQGHVRTPWHGRTLTLQRSDDGGLRAADAAGELASASVGRLVFDTTTLRELMPTGPVEVDERWRAPAAALLALRGSTEPGREATGALELQLLGLREHDGARLAVIAVVATVRLVETRELRGQLRYRTDHRLTLRGRWLHDLDRDRPRSLRLAGSSLLEHTPLEVEFVTPSSEPLAKPFQAEGQLTLELEFR